MGRNVAAVVATSRIPAAAPSPLAVGAPLSSATLPFGLSWEVVAVAGVVAENYVVVVAVLRQERRTRPTIRVASFSRFYQQFELQYRTKFLKGPFVQEAHS